MITKDSVYRLLEFRNVGTGTILPSGNWAASVGAELAKKASVPSGRVSKNKVNGKLILCTIGPNCSTTYVPGALRR